MVDIAIVDYGMGNLRSVEQAFHVVAPNAKVVVTDCPEQVNKAERVVFPGQGAMPDCMRELDARNLRPAILDAAANKPFLGICIGLQMLFQHSQEGDVAGLGILAGDTRRFTSGMTDHVGNKLKVPHMGWNQVHYRTTLSVHPMWNGVDQDARFYYVHSYYVVPTDESLIEATSAYPNDFVCAVARDNLFAVQFHPEKSHTAGLKLLQNFVQWKP